MDEPGAFTGELIGGFCWSHFHTNNKLKDLNNDLTHPRNCAVVAGFSYVASIFMVSYS